MDNSDIKDSIKNASSPSSMKGKSNRCDVKKAGKSSSSGPTLVLLWLWNWFTTIPTAIINFFTYIKNGELLSRFTMLDAILQFIFAVATSCHPQEDPEDDPKANSDKPNDVKVFGGPGKTLRSRTVAANS